MTVHTTAFILEKNECRGVPFIRLIIFDIQDGYKSVRDICEGDVDTEKNRASLARWYGSYIETLESETHGEVKLLNEFSDFGRSKRWASKMTKIFNSL